MIAGPGARLGDGGAGSARMAVAAAAVFGVCWTVLEAVLGGFFQHNYDLLQIVWWRYATHVVLLSVLIGPRIATAVASVRRPALQIARSLTMLIMPVSFASAVGRGATAEQVWSIFWIAPLLVIIFDIAFLGTRPPASAVLASLVGAIAAAVVFGHDALPGKATATLAIVVAVSFALYVVMTRSLRNERVETNLLFTASVPLVVLTLVMPFVWRWPTLGDAMVLTSIGAVGLVALWALDRACSAAPAWIVANVLFVEVLGVVVAIAALSGRIPSSGTLLAATALIAVLIFAWHLAGAACAGLHSTPTDRKRVVP